MKPAQKGTQKSGKNTVASKGLTEGEIAAMRETLRSNILQAQLAYSQALA